MKNLVCREPVVCDHPAGVALVVALLLLALFAGLALAQPPGAMPPAAGQPVALMLEDQFERPAALADHRGAVVVLVYGDRKGTDACRVLGERLHVGWHPEAKGLPPAAARMAPVVGLPGLAPGQMPPDVRVIPVACCGKVPAPVRAAIRKEIAKASPDVPIWLDFGDTMKGMFGLTAGEPNLAVFDAAGRLRLTINGTPDGPAMDRLVKAIETLRQEAAGK